MNHPVLFESFHDMVNTKCVEEEICLCVVPFKKVQGVSAYLCVKCDKMLHSRHPKDSLSLSLDLRDSNP